MAKPKYKFDDQGRIHFSSEGQAVQLKPYVPRSPKVYELLSDQELMEGAGGTLLYDDEIFKNYFLSAFKCYRTKKILKFEIDPDNNICFNNRKLSWVLNNYKVVGFNNHYFDDLITWLAYYNQDTEILKECANDIIINNMRRFEVERKYNFKVPAMNSIDLIEVCPLEGSLKLYAARLHAPRIQEMPVDHNKYLTSEEKKHTSDYCINDLDCTELIFDFVKERLELRSAMSHKYGENLMSKSDAQMAEVVLSKEVKRLSGRHTQRSTFPAGFSFKYTPPAYIRYVTPGFQQMLERVREATFVVNELGKVVLPKELSQSVYLNKGEYRLGIGGLHSSEKCAGYKAGNAYRLLDRDVASYYPNIITNVGIYPESMGRYFLDAYEEIKKERLEAKRTKNFTSDKGLKIFINGASGKFSDQFSNMFDPRCTIQLTVTGQLALLMLVEMFECNDIQVISANTDGIVVNLHDERYNDYLHWVSVWENITGFVTEETEYSCYYARDVNAYFAAKIDGSVKVKGPYSEVGSQSGTQLDNNPVNLICSDAIKNLLGKSIPIEKTIYECKDISRFVTVRNVKGGAHKNRDYLGKVVRWYYAKDEIGTLNYVLTNNKVPDSDGAKPILDLPESFPDDIDYEKYIGMTIDILEEIEYIKKSTQQLFF